MKLFIIFRRKDDTFFRYLQIFLNNYFSLPKSSSNTRRKSYYVIIHFKTEKCFETLNLFKKQL